MRPGEGHVTDPKPLSVDTDVLRRAAGDLRAVGWNVGGAINANAPAMQPAAGANAGFATTAALRESAAAWEKYLRTQADDIQAHVDHLWQAASAYDGADTRARRRTRAYK